MTQQTSGFPASAGPPGDPSTRDVAREQATEVGRSTSEAGQRVAGTAAEQAGEVGREARRQARDLLGQARGQVTEQARNGQQQATDGLRSLAQELQQMADGGERRGPASDLAEQAAERLGDLAEWLQRREPGDLVEELRGLARRRPGAFLLGAAAAGVLVGRLTRGVVDANRDTGPPQHAGRYVAGATPAEHFAPPPPGYGAGPPTPVGTPGEPGWLPPEPHHAPPPPAPGGLAGPDPYPPAPPPRPTPELREPGMATPPTGTPTVHESAGEYVEDSESLGQRTRPDDGGQR